MAAKVCSVDGCETAATARGWCNVHYQRWYSKGDPTKIKRSHTRYHAPPAEPSLVEEIKSVCDVRVDKAERLAGYFELRLAGSDPFAAWAQIDVSGPTAKRYELWFKHFITKRGTP